MKKLINSVLFFTIVFSFFSIFENKEASAHPSKKHKPMICILEKDRTEGQKRNCRQLLFFHRLCKIDQDCAILEIENKKKEIKNKEKEIEAKQSEIKDLQDEIGGLADCGDIPFNHKASVNAKVYQKPSNKSKVVSNVKKGQEMLFIAPSQENKSWYYVKIKKDTSCADGYIQQKFVIKKAGEDKVVKVGPKLIEINQPSWAEEDKLILIDAEGTVSITGAIQDGKIDQIIINEEEEIINGDNSFTFLLFVPSSGSEVRIIGNKNGKKVKELTFKVKVGK
jgi:hypothetical protein